MGVGRRKRNRMIQKMNETGGVGRVELLTIRSGRVLRIENYLIEAWNTTTS